MLTPVLQQLQIVMDASFHQLTCLDQSNQFPTLTILLTHGYYDQRDQLKRDMLTCKAHLCGVSQHKLSAKSLQQHPPFQRHRGRHGQDELVALGCSHKSKPDARVS